MKMRLLRLMLLALAVSVSLLLVHAQDEELEEEGEVFEFVTTSENWVILKSSNGVKFSARNAHATCVYQGRIWVTGGKTDLYKMYNTLYSYKQNDVWWSLDGADWVREIDLRGDFYAQNADTKPVYDQAPWFARFGHTLSPIDMNGDGTDDAMIQLGGFAPGPMNDVWITPDGKTWVYSGLAEWEPRGWHSANTYNNKLYIMGGSPLNNEVWVLNNVVMKDRKEPLTRSIFAKREDGTPYQYVTSWTNLGNADWSPRAGMNVLSQWYFNVANNETIANSTERMVFTGGFGGYILGDGRYDGYRSRGDVWDTYDGITWTKQAEEAFSPRAWHTTQVLHSLADKKLDYADNAAAENMMPRLCMVGGGYIGDSTFNTKISSSMVGLTDLQFSWDGIKWRRVNYEQGNGVRGYDTFVQYYSSQEWTNTIVDSKVNYLGMWGSTSVFKDNTFILIAGDKTGAGPLQSETYAAQAGIICDIEGSVCNGHGTCINEPKTGGCKCSGGCTGLYCEDCPEEEEEVASPEA